VKFKWWFWAALLGVGAVVWYYTRGNGAMSMGDAPSTLVRLTPLDLSGVNKQTGFTRLGTSPFTRTGGSLF
jgi:hypothetical protein